MTVDEYFQNARPQEKSQYVRLQAIVKELAPDAEETIAYGMPTYKLKGKPLVHFGVFKDHMSIFPASGSATDAFAERLSAWKTSKGTLQFTLDNPIPDDLLRDLIKYRLGQIG